MEKTTQNRAEKGIDTLLEIIRKLRSKNGCPWDKKQTPETMWKCLAEEVYELLDAIEQDSPEDICDEMGDVLFQLVFIGELYREKQYFDFEKIISKSAEKMIRRHPHVYKNIKINSEADLHRCWEGIKQQEKKDAGKKQLNSVLDSVPSNMASFLRAYKISEKAARSGFDWNDINGVLKKAEEEWKEFITALTLGDKDEIATEFGDILFTLSNVARFAQIHPETALARSTDKFEKRFRLMEKHVAEKNMKLKDLTREEIDDLWNKSKKSETDAMRKLQYNK